MGIANALALANLIGERGPSHETLVDWERRNRPITEHTQLWSDISWPKSRWPIWGVKAFYDFPLWHEWVRNQRTRTARFVPYGAESVPRWNPAGAQVQRTAA
jgi:hypothetical protein